MSKDGLISISDGLEDEIGRLRGISGDHPTKTEMEETSGPSYGPALPYDTVLKKVGPRVFNEFKRLDEALAGIEKLMSQAVAEQREVESNAAEKLNILLAEIDGVRDAPKPSAAPTGSQPPANSPVGSGSPDGLGGKPTGR